MARIPTYQQRIAPSASGIAPNMQAGRVMASGGMEAIGAGLEKLGAVADKRENINFLLEKDRIESEGRIWASSTGSQADLAMNQYLDKSRKSAQPGAPKFYEDYLKGFDEYKEKTVAAAPSQYAKQLISAHLERSRETYGKAAMMFQSQEFSRYQGQQFDEGVNASASLVYANPAWFQQEMGKWSSTADAATGDAAAKAKLREIAKTNLVGSAVKGWIDRNPREAATILSDWASDPKHGTYASVNLDGETLQIPIGMADFKQQQTLIEYAKNRAESVRSEVAVALRYDTQNLEAMATNGVAPSGPMRSEADFRAAYKNPEVAQHEWARYQAAHGAATATAAMRGKTTEELLRVIQEKPVASDPNFAVSSAAQAVKASAAENIIRARTADPMGYAVQTGEFGLKQLDPANKDAFTEELKRRTAALPEMAAKYGAAAILSKPEAMVMARQIEVLPADQKVAQFETIRSAVSDPVVYGALLNSIRPDSPVTALVGNIAAAGSGDNARMIARGEDLLNPTKDGKKTDGKGAFPMPKEADLRAAWVDAVGTAYRGHPDAEMTAYQAYKAYYAAAASDKGLTDPAVGVDSRIADSAIKAATGGVMRWRTDLFGNSTPSAPIILPYGMPEDRFRDKVTGEWNAARADAGYPTTDIGDVGLFNTGANGEYMVMSGTSWLPGKDGKPIILRIK